MSEFIITPLGVIAGKGEIVGQDETILNYISVMGEATVEEIKKYIYQFKWMRFGGDYYMKSEDVICPRHKIKMILPRGTGHWRCEKCLETVRK